jgi:hypothetical protein
MCDDKIKLKLPYLSSMLPVFRQIGFCTGEIMGTKHARMGLTASCGMEMNSGNLVPPNFQGSGGETRRYGPEPPWGREAASGQFGLAE